MGQVNINKVIKKFIIVNSPKTFFEMNPYEIMPNIEDKKIIKSLLF